MLRKLCRCKWFMLLGISHLFLFTLISAKKHENPASELVNIINANRTSQKLQRLTVNPGLGCIALQYIEECKGSCNSNNTMNCQPPEDDFTEIFAPNCGVELPTFGTLSGRIVGCHSKYIEPPQAFSHILIWDNKTLSMTRNKSYTEVGVGFIGTGKGPFFWCILFSNDKINSTFVLEDGGRGIKQKTGCFSGSNIPCSEGHKIHSFFTTAITVIVTVIFCYIAGI